VARILVGVRMRTAPRSAASERTTVRQPWLIGPPGPSEASVGGRVEVGVPVAPATVPFGVPVAPPTVPVGVGVAPFSVPVGEALELALGLADPLEVALGLADWLELALGLAD
jgi:hypothetical protein